MMFVVITAGFVAGWSGDRRVFEFAYMHSFTPGRYEVDIYVFSGDRG